MKIVITTPVDWYNCIGGILATCGENHQAGKETWELSCESVIWTKIMLIIVVISIGTRV